MYMVGELEVFFDEVEIKIMVGVSDEEVGGWWYGVFGMLSFNWWWLSEI